MSLLKSTDAFLHYLMNRFSFVKTNKDQNHSLSLEDSHLKKGAMRLILSKVSGAPNKDPAFFSVGDGNRHNG